MAEKMIGMTNTHAYSYDNRDQLAGESIAEIAAGYNVAYSYDHAQTTSARDSVRGERVRRLPDRSRSARPAGQGRSRLSKRNGTQPSDDFSYETANKMTNIHIVASSATNRYWYDLAGNLTSNIQNGTITLPVR